MRSVLKAIGDYLFGTLFFMGAFVTIVGGSVIDFETADPSVRLFYGIGVGAFAISTLALLGMFLFGGDEPDEK